MEQEQWIDLRGDDGRLFGRLHRASLELQIVRGDREVCFDLVATARVGRAVVEQRIKTKEALPVGSASFALVRSV